MMKYSTLLFDSDDTLLDFKAAEAAALEKAMLKNALPFSEELLALYSAANVSFWKAYEKGEIKKSEIYVGRFRLFLENAKINFDPKKLSSDYEALLKNECQMIEGAEEICKKLKPHYKMYIVSNGNIYVQLSRLSKSGLDRFFDGVFVSERVGFSKPQKEFFEHVFEEIGVTDLSRVLIIGDSVSSDIKGGKNAGIDTCLFSASGEIKGADPTYTVHNHNELEKLLLKELGQ